MLVFIMIVTVLIGVAYADYCLIDNTAHFGICFAKVAEAEASEASEASEELDDAESRPATEESSTPSTGSEAIVSRGDPLLAWMLQDIEPVLELREGGTALPGRV